MDKKKIDSRTQVKSFIKVVNVNHVMPTRHLTNFDSIKDIKPDTFEFKKQQTKKARKAINDDFTEVYRTKGANDWFFSKLRF